MLEGARVTRSLDGQLRRTNEARRSMSVNIGKVKSRAEMKTNEAIGLYNFELNVKVHTRSIDEANVKARKRVRKVDSKNVIESIEIETFEESKKCDLSGNRAKESEKSKELAENKREKESERDEHGDPSITNNS